MKPLTQKTLVLLLFVISNTLLPATYSAFAQNPSTLKWSQIKTPHFRVIFPKGTDSLAQRTANVLETIHEPVSNSLGISPRPIPFLLQNQTVIANGFVTITPRYSEFNTASLPNETLLGTNNWVDLLSVHEYRHVVQFEKAFQGKGKILRFLFGNRGPELIASLAVPNWFWEGDAVGTETAFTASGRGRIPSFDMALRTQLLTRGMFPYAKSVAGSYSDYVPNHYVNGYFLTTYLKNKFGKQVWDGILTGLYEQPFYPFSFSNNVKKVTGLSVEKLYQQAYEDVSEQWKTQALSIKETPASYYEITRPSHFTNYEFPQLIEDGRVVALKSGLSAIQQLVLVSKIGKEEKIVDIGVLNDANTLSASGNKVVWTEVAYHPRWTMKTYSVIKIVDVKKGVIQQLTHKSRLTAPALDPDGAKVVAVETDVANVNSLVVLDAQSGKELNSIKNVTNALFIHPTWVDNKKVVVVRLLNGKKTILTIDVATGKAEEAFEPVNENIAHPYQNGEWIYFNSGITGIDNIYAFHTLTKQRFQVTNRKFGAFNAVVSVNGKSLVFNDFTEKGHRIASMPLDTSTWVPFDEQLHKPVRYFGQMLVQEAGQNLLKSIGDSTYHVKGYRKSNLLNFTATGLLLNSLDNNLTFGLSSQNLLNTAIATGGITYNANENTMGHFVSATYQGWYPLVDFSYTNGQRKASVYLDKDTKLDSLRSDTWKQQQWLMGFRLPLNFTHSKYKEALSLGVHLSINQIEGYDLPKRLNLSSGINGNVNSMIYSIAYSRLLKRAVRDIAPQWGQAISLYHRKSFTSVLDGGISSVQGIAYFPGLVRHHSFRIRGAYQYQSALKTVDGDVNPRFYSFTTTIAMPRGYSYQNLENLWTATAEYALPIADPDWNWGRFLYVKRIKSTFFADLGQGETYYSKIKKQDLVNYTSLGIDLSVEFHPFRYQNPLELGIRVLHQPRTGVTLVQPLVINIGF